MMPSFSLWLAALVLTASAAAGLSWKITAAHAELRRMECVQAREVERREAAEASANLYRRAESAETQAAHTLAAVRAETQRKLKESQREIARLSSGRECLSGALRLHLNTTLATDGLPTGSGAAAGAAADVAADSGDVASASTLTPALSLGERGQSAAGASDGGIAQWVLDAAAQYDDCRARLDAIRQWDEVTHGR